MNLIQIDAERNKGHLAAHAAEARWRKETGGVTVVGVLVATDDRSRSLIQGAYLQALHDPKYVTGWKTEGGFVPLNATQVEMIALAVAAHVQACFAKEAEVLAAIAAEEITTTEEVDSAFAQLSTEYGS